MFLIPGNRNPQESRIRCVGIEYEVNESSTRRDSQFRIFGPRIGSQLAIIGTNSGFYNPDLHMGCAGPGFRNSTAELEPEFVVRESEIQLLTENSFHFRSKISDSLIREKSGISCSGPHFSFPNMLDIFAIFNNAISRLISSFVDHPKTNYKIIFIVESKNMKTLNPKQRKYRSFGGN